MSKMNRADSGARAPPPPPSAGAATAGLNGSAPGSGPAPSDSTAIVAKRKSVSQHMLSSRRYTHMGYRRRMHKLLAQEIPRIIEREKRRRYPKTHHMLSSGRKSTTDKNGNERINIGQDTVQNVLDMVTIGLKPFIRRVLEMQLHRRKDTLLPEDIQVVDPFVMPFNIPNPFYPDDYQRKLGASWYMERRLSSDLTRIDKKQKQEREQRKLMNINAVRALASEAPATKPAKKKSSADGTAPAKKAARAADAPRATEKRARSKSPPAKDAPAKKAKANKDATAAAAPGDSKAPKAAKAKSKAHDNKEDKPKAKRAPKQSTKKPQTA